MTTIRQVDLPVDTAAPFRLPDIPERHPDDMTSVDSLHRHGAIANIIQYLGRPQNTIVSAEHYVVPGPAYVAGESRYPDLLVAFGVSPEAYAASNGYVVSQQGKPPDFILEVDPGTPPETTWRRSGIIMSRWAWASTGCSTARGSFMASPCGVTGWKVADTGP